MEQEKYIGFDIHRKYSEVCVEEKDGKILERRRLYHDDVLGLREYLEKYSGSEAVMEATVGWMWLADELESVGIEVHLAHSLGTALIARSRMKTDKADAKILADLLRTNFLHESYLAPREVRELREILRFRAALVRTQTVVKNRIHAVLIRLNIQPAEKDIFGKKGTEMLRMLAIGEPYRSIVDGWLDMISYLKVQIKSVEKIIKKQLGQDERVKYLITLPGVGLLTAYTMIAEIGNIDRFPSEKSFASYCGLVPSTRSSADVTHHGRIGAGRKTLQWCFVESSRTAIRRDSYFAEIYHKHDRGKGDGKSIVIVAHQMTMIVYKMLKNKRGYVPRPKQRKHINHEVGPIAPMAN